MIIFNELRITPDSSCLIIDASINPDPVYDGIILDKVTIATLANYNPNGTIDDSTQTLVYDINTRTEWDIILDDTHRHIRLVLPAEDLKQTVAINHIVEDSPLPNNGNLPDPTDTNLRSITREVSVFDPPIDLSGRNIYFVYAHADVSNATGAYMSAPCGCANETKIGTIINGTLVYNQLLLGVKELGNTCQVPTGFINSYLQLQATNTAVNTGNYSLAIRFWNQFYATGKKVQATKGCGCHGRY